MQRWDCPGVRLLGHMLVLVFVFQGISILFFIGATPIYILFYPFLKEPSLEPTYLANYHLIYFLSSAEQFSESMSKLTVSKVLVHLHAPIWII